MEEHSCYGCGEDIQVGDLRYMVKIDISAGYDWVMPEYTEDVQKELFSLSQAVRSMESRRLEEDVHQEFYLLLCSDCKEKFAHSLMKEACGGQREDHPKVVH